MATINGNDRNNRLTGTQEGDTINGFGGNDRIYARGGDDAIRGGDGRDYIDGGSGRDIMDGDAGNDRLYGRDGNDGMAGGQGNDRLWGGNGDDQMNGGTGNDRLWGENGNDLLNGNEGDDRLWGGKGNDELYGFSQNPDSKVQDNGNDQLWGGEGDDQIFGGAGDDRLYGDFGGSSSGGSGSGGSGSGNSATVTFNDYLDGGAGNDVIFGEQGDDTLLGGDGNDRLYGDFGGSGSGGSGSGGSGSGGSGSGSGGSGSGSSASVTFNDYLDGGAGNDIVFGEQGNDTAVYNMAENFGATDRYDGGSGIDTLCLEFTADEWLSPNVQADIAAYLAFLAANTNASSGEANGRSFQFTAFDLKASRFENLKVIVDSVDLDPTDQAVLAIADSYDVDEDGPVLGSAPTLNVTDNDVVPDLVSTVTLITDVPTGEGDLTLNSDGTFTYDPGGDFEYLAKGETEDVTFEYEVKDADGDTDTAIATISVTGENDAPVVTMADTTGAVTELPNNDPGENMTSLTDDGVVAFADVDLSDGHSTSVTLVSAIDSINGAVGARGALTANVTDPSTGDGTGEVTWNFAVDDSALDDLEEGQTLTQVYSVEISDGKGGNTAEDVTIVITGAADNTAPTVSASAPAGFIEDPDASAQTLTENGTVSFDDVDPGDDVDITFASNGDIAWTGGTLDPGLATALVSGFNGTAVTNAPAPGSTPWSYNAAGLDLDFLGEGEEITFSFDVTATDADGATDTDKISFSIVGTNDGPTVGFVADPVPPADPNLNVTDLDGTNGITLNGAAAGHQAGTAIGALDFNNDGFLDLFVASGNGDTVNNTSDGIAYIAFGSAAGFAPVVELSTISGAAGFTLEGTLTGASFFGRQLAVGDFNNDGIDDFAAGNLRAGLTNVVFGSASDITGGDSVIIASEFAAGNSTIGFEIKQAAGGDLTGRLATGDFNGDGIGDLIIGSPQADPNGSNSGQTYVLYGSPIIEADGDGELNLAEIEPASPQIGIEINGITNGDGFQSNLVASGDFNGDGFDDVLITARRADPPSGTDAGKSYVLFGSATDITGGDNVFELSDLNGTNGFALTGVSAGDAAGFSAASAGDVNGDGIDDILIGARDADPGATVTGAAYVIYGQLGGWVPSFDLGSLNGTNGFVVTGANSGDQLGTSVAGAGDLNNDGFDDILIGAQSADPNGSGSGQVAVIYGGASLGATISAGALDGQNGYLLNGAAASDILGATVAGIGDLNGDGFDDFMAGAVLADPNGNSSGQAYVVYGKATNSTAESNAVNRNFLEAEDASAQVLSDAGTVEFDDLDVNDTIDITFASNNDIVWSGGTLDATLAAALVAGFSTGISGAAAPGTTPWTYGTSGLNLDFMAADDTISFSYDVTAEDSQGATATDTITFTITGTADPFPLNGGSFEVPEVTAGNGVLFESAANGDWTFADPEPAASLSGIVENGSIFGNAVAPEGDQVAYLQYALSNGGTISQTFTAEASDYFLTFDMATRNLGITSKFEVRVDGVTVETIAATNVGSYQQETINLGGLTPGAHTIEFEALSATGLPNEDTTTFLDNVVIEQGTAIDAEDDTIAIGNTGASRFSVNDLLGNDTAGKGTLTVTGVDDAANGIVILDHKGTLADTSDDEIIFAPNADFSETDSFTYTVTDGNGDTATATVTVTADARVYDSTFIADQPNSTGPNDNTKIVEAAGLASLIDIYGDAGNLFTPALIPVLEINGFLPVTSLGDDHIIAGSNTDELLGDVFELRISASPAPGLALAGADILEGGAVTNSLTGDAYIVDANVAGTYEIGADDILEAGPGTASLFGDNLFVGVDATTTLIFGNDILLGGNGDNFIVGDALIFSEGVFGAASSTFGNDILVGGSGDDTFYGDVLPFAANGTLTNGRDIFVFGPGSGDDTIEDFQTGTDLIDVTAYGITGLAGFAAVSTLGGTTTITLDGPGNTIQLTGIASVTAEDFIFA